MTLSQGDRLGRFEILASIGAGGMGEVWRARDTELGREVAIKVLPPQVADSPDRRKRFEREARATAALNHPNLLTVHDVGIDHDQPYIVTELLEGETLRRVLRHGPPPPVSAVAWSLGIAHGLAAAHSRNVVHRDLKPDNVFLTTDNRVKILDFGLAKILETETADEDETAALSSDTAAGTLLGTMGYMAPEQLRGDPVDTRTDVFAFGCVLYEMLSGRRPFAGGSSADYVSAALRDNPAPLDDALSLGLRAIVRRCLEKRPAARYQGAGELVAVLETLDPDSLGTVSGAQSAPLIAAARSGAEPAVAVMPFANLSNDEEQEYFCDGMTEEILGAIGKVRGLKVLARSSSFAFKGKEADPREVGRTIGADHLLEGSVRRAGDQVRITARLVQATDGTQLWADRYDRTISDIFELQDEISIDVANQLRTTLFLDEIADLRQRHIPDREANDLYLRGRYLWYRRREGDLQTAIGLFETAIARDPEYVLPHAGIAEVFCVLGLNAYIDPKIAFARVRAELDQVFVLDENVASAHAVRGALYGYHEYRWELAEESFQRAIELEPNWGFVRCWYAGFLGGLRRLDESEIQARAAADAEPMAPLVQALAGINLLNAGSKEGFIYLRRALEMDPRHPVVNHYLGQKLAYLGRYEEAIPLLEIGFRAGLVLDAGTLACAYAKLGQTDRLEAINAQLDELATKRYVSHFTRALIAFGKGDGDGFFNCIYASRQQGEIEAMLIECIDFLTPLRDHPRYRSYLQQLGIPEGIVPNAVDSS
jgi:TolB-like protein/Tfp pilus assembly protein PilF